MKGMRVASDGLRDGAEDMLMRTIAIIAMVLLVQAAALAAVVHFGLYNVAASVPHTAAGRWLLDTLQQRSVAARARDVQVPSLDEPHLVRAGAEHYREMCVVCHGAPGVERGEIGNSLTPTPPDLAKAARMWTDAELFWIVKHGIKLAGMPAFGETHGDDELWKIAAFVRRLPEMSSGEYRELAGAPGRAAGHGHDAGTGG
jgi:mono/diheme cytochrome c family protein